MPAVSQTEIGSSEGLIAVTTRFTLRSWTKYPLMARLTRKAARQAVASDGIVHVSIKPFTLRTLTVWKTVDHMVAYRNAGAHLEAMQMTAKLGRNRSVNWRVNTVPNWSEAIAKLDEVALVRS